MLTVLDGCAFVGVCAPSRLSALGLGASQQVAAVSVSRYSTALSLKDARRPNYRLVPLWCTVSLGTFHHRRRHAPHAAPLATIPSLRIHYTPHRTPPLPSCHSCSDEDKRRRSGSGIVG